MEESNCLRSKSPETIVTVSHLNFWWWSGTYQFWRMIRVTEQGLGDAAFHRSLAQTFDVEHSLTVVGDARGDADARADTQRTTGRTC